MALVPVPDTHGYIYNINYPPLQQMDKAIRRLGEGISQPLSGTGTWSNWVSGLTGCETVLEVDRIKSFLILPRAENSADGHSGRAELLNEQVVGNLNAQQREILAILKDNTLRLQKLIENLLDFNVASSRGSQLHVEQVA